ncbi:carbamoyl-phosphate synthase large subunit [Zhaonella formicivorans]|uniref:carbamoyl-phosphate synthase large subunit n=1 Tax=Zhaonella formicivorans TaxID=2528593 RepID=UPI0010E97A08|nr:carbamoyl-phosphate synthase large subunit [Zhaonella formicivorans]
MPKKEMLKVLVIGSGPIVIGQGAEFDYAGTQACRALMEEGLEIVLANSNPATIMTEADMAHRIYFEPLTAEFLTRIIAKERPQGILPTMGGQIGLNLASELDRKGVLKNYGVQLLGTPLEAIEQSEDRELFKKCMESIGEPVLESFIAKTEEEAVKYARSIGYPVIIRPAYTLGGTGGGIATSEEEVKTIAFRGLKASPVGQVLIERSVVGWKEIEYEVIRDGNDNCLAVCSMENVDPVGIHTGDSIVVAPVQTLSDVEHQMLRAAALKIIRALKIEGGCNVQFALDPQSLSYYVIEVNPRVSRSSALASKATGYPIARVAAKIAVGYTLDQIQNKITGTTSCFEPALDYVVVKIPRFPFDKLRGERTLGTQMKATGEAMAIDRTFERALLKGLRGLELSNGSQHLWKIKQASLQEIQEQLRLASDLRIFYIFEAFHRGLNVLEVAELTKIDLFFLAKMHKIAVQEQELQGNRGVLNKEQVQKAKVLGISDTRVAELLGVSEKAVREFRKEQGICPVYKMVDTCAAEFAALTPYYYSTYDWQDEVELKPGRKIAVLGSGPIRIGQGIEFDYGAVECTRALKEAGITAIAVNNNPETVSTDFDIADKLYFEPLTVEDVMHILDKEQPEGVIVQFGGQTAINLAKGLAAWGVPILGTTLEAIDLAEDRDKFDRLLTDLGIPKPPGSGAASPEEAVQIAANLGYPVMVRPSYVIGGRGMEIVYNQEELLHYLTEALELSQDCPVLIDKYFSGTEVEVDAVSDCEEVLIPGIMQHIERPGVHSGDSIAVYPAFDLSHKAVSRIIEYTKLLAKALAVKGLFNIQFIVQGDEVFVLEVNPRSSRTVPFLSKVTGIPLTAIATKVILGERLKDQGYGTGLYPPAAHFAVKVPVFSLAKLQQTDVSLGPEMKSTGEVMGIDYSLSGALYKGLVAAGYDLPQRGKVLAAIAERDKRESLPLLQELAQLGYTIYATPGTAKVLRQAGLTVLETGDEQSRETELLKLLREKHFDIVLNTLTQGKDPSRLGFRIRRTAAEYGVTCLTSLDTAKAVVRLLAELRQSQSQITVNPIQEYLGCLEIEQVG